MHFPVPRGAKLGSRRGESLVPKGAKLGSQRGESKGIGFECV